MPEPKRIPTCGTWDHHWHDGGTFTNEYRGTYYGWPRYECCKCKAVSAYAALYFPLVHEGPAAECELLRIRNQVLSRNKSDA